MRVVKAGRSRRRRCGSKRDEEELGGEDDGFHALRREVDAELVSSHVDEHSSDAR